MKVMLPRMIKENWLLSYRNIGGIDRVLQGLSGRISRANNLFEGVSELERNYEDLEFDFLAFFPQIIGYISQI
jgi:acyl carrier protein phosphodiesterase